VKAFRVCLGAATSP